MCFLGDVCLRDGGEGEGEGVRSSDLITDLPLSGETVRGTGVWCTATRTLPAPG